MIPFGALNVAIRKQRCYAKLSKGILRNWYSNQRLVNQRPTMLMNADKPRHGEKNDLLNIIARTPTLYYTYRSSSRKQNNNATRKPNVDAEGYLEE